jgi:hypothetical protein
MSLKAIIVRYGQSTSDIALENYGCFEGANQLMLDNPGILSADQILQPGTMLYVQNPVPVFTDSNTQIVQTLVNDGTLISTGLKPAAQIGGQGIQTESEQDITTESGGSLFTEQ